MYFEFALCFKPILLLNVMGPMMFFKINQEYKSSALEHYTQKTKNASSRGESQVQACQILVIADPIY